MGGFLKASMSPHEIYQNFATARGTETLDDAQHATRVEWEREIERALLIRRQGLLIRDGWDGPASDAAAGAAWPLAKAAEDGADLLRQAEDLLDRQSGSFHRAANSVQPMSGAPPELDLSGPIDLNDDFEEKVNAYKASAQHNLDVYGGYDGASEYNETNMPADYPLHDIQGSDASVAVGDPADTGNYIEVEDGPRGEDSSWPSGSDAPIDGPPVGGPPFGGPPAGEPPVGGPSSGPAGTSPNNFVPPPVTSPNQWSPSPTPAGPAGPGLVAGFPVGGPGAPGGMPGRSGGPGAPGGGPGGPGPGRGVVGPGVGMRGGALAAEEAARRAAAAAARGSGQGLMGAPAGAGRGKGDEDEEHRRKVLLEVDGESVFGSDQLTAPEVIGDDEYEND